MGKGTAGETWKWSRKGPGKRVKFMWLPMVGGGNPAGFFSPLEKILQ